MVEKIKDSVPDGVRWTLGSFDFAELFGKGRRTDLKNELVKLYKEAATMEV